MRLHGGFRSGLTGWKGFRNRAATVKRLDAKRPVSRKAVVCIGHMTILLS